jgi:GTPase involved in cell partitioning and DNA repair
MIHRYQAIRNELGLFNEKLLHKPEIVVINKVDLLQADAALVERARTELRKRIASIRGTHPIPNEPFVVSAVSGTGVQDLVFAIYEELKSYREQVNQGPKKTTLPDDQSIRS